MQSLATDVLRNLKQKANFWKVTTIVCLTLAVAEFIAIIF